MNKLKLSLKIILIVIILIILLFIFTTITFNDIKNIYKKILNDKYKSCISVLPYSNDINIYYKFINLINTYEYDKTDNKCKSQISIKINDFGNNNDIIIKNIKEFLKKANDSDIFIWISALYKDTVKMEYTLYKELFKEYKNLGLTLSCSQSSVSKTVDEILLNNGHVRLVKGLYKGDITNDQSIKKIYIKNAIKLCNSNNYQCICTHDFSIINNLDIYKNKNLELSFYYRNFNYVKKNIKKYEIKVKYISFYYAYGIKIRGLFYKRNKSKLPYYIKKRIYLAPYHNLIN